ncbi:MAG: Zn-ribbon domain-containing OB-fold protein [Microthrixaceae bacterium]
MADRTGDHDILRAPLTIGYDFQRTTGPVIGAFFTALREHRMLGIRDTAGRVVCPPVEYDPQSGEPLTEMVEVGTEGTVTTWSWVSQVREDQPLDVPHAVALVRLDGADTSMLHAVDAGSPERIGTGTRVRVRWREESVGGIRDIACFEPIEGADGA